MTNEVHYIYLMVSVHVSFFLVTMSLTVSVCRCALILLHFTMSLFIPSVIMSIFGYVAVRLSHQFSVTTFHVIWCHVAFTIPPYYAVTNVWLSLELSFIRHFLSRLPYYHLCVLLRRYSVIVSNYCARQLLIFCTLSASSLLLTVTSNYNDNAPLQ